MIPQLQLTTLVYAIVGVYGVVLACEGARLTTGLFKPCGTVATAVVLALLAFDKWAWSFRFLHPWFVDKPYIKGTWKGTLVSNYIDPSTNQRDRPDHRLPRHSTDLLHDLPDAAHRTVKFRDDFEQLYQRVGRRVHRRLDL